MPKPLLLVILDGFGVSTEKTGNPTAEANAPTLREMEAFFPWTTLQASGVAVGLPWGEAGNSEVGHLTMGAGRVIYHHLPRIMTAIGDGSFFTNDAFKAAAEHAKKNNSRFHIAGLVSSGSVHSYFEHLEALLEFTKQEGLADVRLHIFTDGKDAPPQEGAKFFAEFEERLKKEWPHAHIASAAGRYWALDRDEQWGRVREAYELMTRGKGERASSLSEYLKKSYAKGLTDEFIKPAVIAAEGEEAITISKGDALVFTDFREDSIREIARAFAEEAFDKFPREKVPGLFVATMTEYQKNLPVASAFPPLEITRPFARVIGEAGLKHLHIAETQKYAHVTYFFNGGREEALPGEERMLVPSLPADHFDTVPEMKAPEITKRVIDGFGKYDVVIANYANADMVGHSGNWQAAVKAVEALDEALSALKAMILESDGVMLVTADHGNIELKRNVMTGEKLTEHSPNPVPFFLIGKKFRREAGRSDAEIKKMKTEVGGILTDIAPTALELLELEKPKEMTGKSLLSLLTRQ